MLPMILYISETFDRNRNLSRFYQILLWMQPIFAGFLSISLLAPADAFPFHIFFAVLWFLYTLLAGAFGLSRLIRRGFRPLAETAIDTALLYLPLGGFWFIMYQFDQPFMSFAVPILLLITIHFHYSSLVAPVFLGMTGRFLGYHRLLQTATLLVMISPILIAIGITYSVWVEFLAVSLFVASLWFYSLLLLFRVVPKVTHPIAKFGFLLSGLSTLVSMLAALVYAFGRITATPLLTIDQMMWIHGFVNTFVFSLGSAIGWMIVRPAPAYQTGIPFSRLQGTGLIGADFFARNRMITNRTTVGLVDNMDEFASNSFHPEKLPPVIRDFYERTNDYELIVHPVWKTGFRSGARLFKSFSRRIEQMNFPLANEKREVKMESYIIPLKDTPDGRENVRAWVRIFSETRLPINETIRVCTADNAAKELPDARTTVVARHEMWLLGIRFLTLDYFIFPVTFTEKTESVNLL